jgi:CAAX protease family protein
MVLPLWMRVLAVIGAGVIEEMLFTGYAVTRLTWLTGRVWLAAALSLLVFCALHVPAWGMGPAVAFFVGGVPSMAFFVWRRDLLAMIVAHVMIDGWGLVLAPLFTEWWKTPTYS